MNLFHRWYCRSGRWVRRLYGAILPAALAGAPAWPRSLPRRPGAPTVAAGPPASPVGGHRSPPDGSSASAKRFTQVRKASASTVARR